MSTELEILNKLKSIETRVIVIETEFKLLKKLVFGIVGGVAAILGIPFVT